MSNVTATINQLNAATTVVILVLSFVNFVPGSIGLVLNVVIFTRPRLRREPCSLYFLSSTCFNLFVIFVVLPVRILSSGFDIDATRYSLGICKIEYFTFFSTRAISCWLIALACVDRYLHSSLNIRLRQMSSLKTARLSIAITSVLLMILYSHMLIYYDITNTSTQVDVIIPRCNAQKGFYRNFNGFWHMVFYSLCPSFLMLVFGSLTLNNIHRHRQILPVVNTNNPTGRRTNNQLLSMLITQVLFIIVSTLPYSINYLYGSFTTNVSKNALRVAQENLATQTVNTMAYFAHASSFYLYTLTGSDFRKELYKIITCSLHHRNPTHTSRDQTNLKPS